MKTAVFTVLLVLAMLGAKVFAQPNDLLKPLMKGDTLPNLKVAIHIEDSIHYKELKSFKKKLILLDFWGIRCSSCISAMEPLLNLQNQFKDDLQILVVTENSEDEINNLWTKLMQKASTIKWPKIAKQLPFIKEDTLFCRLIPHKVIPTHVWLDSNLVVRSIAYSSSTNSQNIKSFLNGEEVKLDEQRILDLNIDKPMTWIGKSPEFENLYRSYSLLTARIEYGAGSRSKFYLGEDNTTIIGYSCLNVTILDLYKLAYKNWMPSSAEIPQNRIILEVENKDKFNWPSEKNTRLWALDSNTFCYAIRHYNNDKNSLYRTMAADLDNSFNLKSGIEKRKVKCLVLKRISTIDKIKTKGSTPQSIKSDKLIIKNMDFKVLYNKIRNVLSVQSFDFPSLDETNYKGKIDIELPWNEEYINVSLKQIKEALRLYDLDLVEEYRVIEMLVIKRPKLL